MLNRRVAPAYQPVQTIDFPEPERIELSSGMPAFFLNYGEQEVLRIEWISHSGRIIESQVGLSFFALKMLGEGAGNLDSEGLQEAFQQYGAFLDFKNGFDYNTLTIYTLSRYLENILVLLKDMIRQPRMEAEDLETLKNIKCQEIRLNQRKNNIQASHLFREAIFGKEHPYGKSLTEQQAKAVTLEQVKSYVDSQLFRDSFLLVSGKITPAQLNIISRLLSDIDHPKRNSDIALPSAPPVPASRELEDSLQCSVRYGKKFLRMDHPDYIPMLIVNEILGGYFGSRLMKNIREDKGYTYGIYSSVVSLNREGYLVIGADVIKENRDDTFKEIDKELKLLREKPVGEEELETVKNYMLGNLVSSMDTAFDLADKFKNVHQNGLGVDYYQHLVQTIHGIDPLTIRNLAQKYLDSDTFVRVTVG